MTKKSATTERASYKDVSIALLALAGIVIAALTVLLMIQQSQASMTSPTILPTRSVAVERVINAVDGLVPMGITVSQGSTIHIEVIGGEWTTSLGNQPYSTGDGVAEVCADIRTERDCAEPIASTPTDALVGKVGVNGEPFFIGSERTIVVEEGGELFLGMNDIGVGLTDNDGYLMVRIVIPAG
jgi:hypothetical protein